MTFDKARDDWKEAHPEEEWDGLTDEQKTDVLTEAVKAERAADPKRKK